MKKGVFYLTAIVLVLGVLLSASIAPSAAKEITLRWSTWTVFGGAHPEAGRWWMDEITRLTDNRVKFETHYTGSLIPAGQDARLVGKGVADISMLFVPFLGEACPLTSVLSIPGLKTKPLAYNNALYDLMQMEELKKEFAKSNLMVVCPEGGSPRNITSLKPIVSLKDLKGVKIRALGDEAKLMKKLGATPLGLKSNECYEALERGTIDAVIMSPAGVDAWKLYEVGKHHTVFGTSYDSFMMIMNLKTWNRLPADIQKVFVEVGKKMPYKFYDHYYVKGEKVRYLKELFPQSGVTVHELPAADKAEYTKAAQPLWEAWVKNYEKKGLPARKIVDEWLRLNEKYL